MAEELQKETGEVQKAASKNYEREEITVQNIWDTEANTCEQVFGGVEFDPFQVESPGDPDALRRMRDATASERADKAFVLGMVAANGLALQYASDALKFDKEVVLAAVAANGLALRDASDAMKEDKDVVMCAVTQNGMALREAADRHKEDKEVVLAAVTNNGDSLLFARNLLREDREVVVEAVRVTPCSLQFAKGGLNQDAEMLKASGLWDYDYETKSYGRSEQAMLCCKFSLAEQSTRDATLFMLAVKKDPYLGQFKTWNANCWCKKSCDPRFTDFQHPCRGTLATCGFPQGENCTDTGRPKNTSCWRYSFRFHQEECKATNGFMYQLQEPIGLGDGQKIQTDMAKQVDLKVFRILVSRGCTYRHLRPVREAIDAWYKSGCVNRDMEILHLK